MTHGELSEELVPRGFESSSIFRNLVDLTEAGLVSRTDLGDRTWRYHAAGGEDLPGLESMDVRHPHFVCIECGGIQCLEAVEVTVKAPRKRAPKAVLRTNVEINFRGYCDACIAMA